MTVTATEPQSYHEDMLRRIAMIDALGKRQTALDRERIQAKTYAQQMPKLQQPSMGGGVGAQATGGFASFLNAIAGQESGGSYSARNGDSGAMGKYQIMPSNLGGSKSGWDYEALGYDINPSQFMGNPQLQDAIAQYKLQQYYNKYGAAGAAVAWYAGPGTANSYMNNPSGYNNPQGNYPSIASYVQQVMNRMG